MITTTVTRYTVTAATPEQNEYLYSLFGIQVELVHQKDGTEKWAVRRLGQCLSKSGVWAWEPQPSSRTNRFLANHRFDLDTALKLAEEAAPRVTVNGYLPDGSRQA